MCTKIFSILVHIELIALLFFPVFLLPASSCAVEEIQITGTGTEGASVPPAELEETEARQGTIQAEIPPAAGTTDAQDTDAEAPEAGTEASLTPQAAGNSSAMPNGDDWISLEPGLQYTELKTDTFRLHVLRIDPAFFSFVLCASGKEKSEQMTLQEWSEKKDLIASINASMYLPDGQTSTGYMRDGEYINNNRMVQRFGAFFVADPDDPDLPQATILEKDDDIGKELLPHYRLVIQNYRIINSQRRILWSPGGPLYSISAVAIDGDGNVLFLHSQEPIEAYTFAQQLLHLPIDVRTVMYVEGGGQAGLVIRSHKLSREMQGQNILDFLITGNRAARLPNVLGIRRIH